MSRPDEKVFVVATTHIDIGSVLRVPPADDGLDRAHVYAFEFPLKAALTIARNGSMRPAFPEDAKRMSQFGVDMEPFYSVPRDGVAQALEDEAFFEDGPELALIREALEDGRKAALVEALELIGEDMSGLTNNTLRRAALEAHLTE